MSVVKGRSHIDISILDHVTETRFQDVDGKIDYEITDSGIHLVIDVRCSGMSRSIRDGVELPVSKLSLELG